MIVIIDVAAAEMAVIKSKPLIDKKAVTINDPDQLGGTMIKNFLELFDTKKK